MTAVAGAGLAGSLVVGPAIPLLDGPLSNRDAALREEMPFGIRRPHDALRITSIYGTHDRAPAVATADRIAVMQRGRILQVGSPQGGQGRPRSAVVAAFPGRTSLIPGAAEAPRIGWQGGRRVHPAPLPGPAAGRGGGLPGRRQHRLEGKVLRATDFGGGVDHLVEAPALGQGLRVAGPPAPQVASGESLTLGADPARCLVPPED